MLILDHIRSFIENSILDPIRTFTFTPVMVFPVIVILFLIIFFIRYFKALQPQSSTAEWIKMIISKDILTFFNRRHPMEKRDIAPLTIITLVFLVLSLFNLGSTNTIDVPGEIEIMMETHSLSPGSNHYNNMYFDEIYFVRTAVEHIESQPPYEISHPPLGKEIIAASILAIGMSPFGWRLAGAMCGILMLVVLYIFIKNMFGKTVIATCGTLLLGFDFMRFVQTRIATIDSFVVLFILLSFFFMYRHITTNIDAPFKKSLAPLALSGLFFGLSFATKWIGFYAGAGLLIIYVIRLSQLGYYYSLFKKRGFGLYLTKTLLFSLLFFVIIPAIIYYITYIPYGLARGMAPGIDMLFREDYFELVRSNQVIMFTYHSRLTAEHPFSSVWWQWILNTSPILYVNSYVDNSRATFGAFGNPVVWWGGFVAMIAMVVRIFTHRDGKSLFILIGFLSQLLPWVLVSRILFAYHYFPSTIFIVLALSHVFNTMIERQKRAGKAAVYTYTTVSGVVFALFYPALSGIFMPSLYYSNIIKWLNTWPF